MSIAAAPMGRMPLGPALNVPALPGSVNSANDKIEDDKYSNG